MSQFGFRLHVSITEYMETVPTQENIKFNSKNLKKVQIFRFPRTNLLSNGDNEGGVNANSAWMKWREVLGQCAILKMPLRLKSKTYRAVARSVANVRMELNSGH